MSGEQRCCELCGRSVTRLSRHHLVPRTRHGSKRSHRVDDRRELRERVARLCRPCHGQVHALLSEKELERSCDTLEKLAAHPEVQRFVAWVRDKPDGTRVPALRARGRGRGGKGPR